MTNETMNAGDARPTRLRALYDRIGALPDAALEEVERKVSAITARLSETARVRADVPLPGTTRTVLGATITDRPDLAYAAQIAGAPVVDHAPAPEHAAELAKVGGHAR